MSDAIRAMPADEWRRLVLEVLAEPDRVLADLCDFRRLVPVSVVDQVEAAAEHMSRVADRLMDDLGAREATELENVVGLLVLGRSSACVHLDAALSAGSAIPAVAHASTRVVGCIDCATEAPDALRPDQCDLCEAEADGFYTFISSVSAYIVTAEICQVCFDMVEGAS